jgi:dihydropyrimidinase
VVRIVISGGMIISATGAAPLDVLTDGEQIAALAAPGTKVAASWAASADRVISAAGKYVLPGGIDAHTHMEMPFGGTLSADTFETGTRAAAWGGTTTMIDFAVQAKGTSLLSNLDSWHRKADGTARSTTGST